MKNFKIVLIPKILRYVLLGSEGLFFNLAIIGKATCNLIGFIIFIGKVTSWKVKV